MRSPIAVIAAAVVALATIPSGAVGSDEPSCKNHYILRCGAAPIVVWQKIAPMAVPTGAGASAAALADGRVLVTGGLSAGRAAQVFDPTAKTWTSVAPMHASRANHAAVRLQDGRVLVVGGDAMPAFSAAPAPTVAATAEVYDPRLDRWTATGPLATFRATWTYRDIKATLLVDGSVLVTGGSDSRWNGERSTETYDPASNMWTISGPLQMGRVGHTATLLEDGSVVVVGGVGDWDFRFFAPGLERYDPTNRTWRPMAGAIAVSGHTATMMSDGRILVSGGQVAAPVTGPNVPQGATWPSASTTAVVAFTAAGAFESMGPLAAPRHGHLAIAYASGEVLVVGGLWDRMPVVYQFSEDDVSTIDAFDPLAHTWRQVEQWGPMPQGPQTATALPDGTVLVTAVYDAALLSYQPAQSLSKPRRVTR